jgi:hypothetical protein
VELLLEQSHSQNDKELHGQPQLHGSPSDVELESAVGMIRYRTARRMARTGTVSSCVFYHSEEAQMFREHNTKLLLSAENKVHSPGSARGV